MSKLSEFKNYKKRQAQPMADIVITVGQASTADMLNIADEREEKLPEPLTV